MLSTLGTKLAYFYFHYLFCYLNFMIPPSANSLFFLNLQLVFNCIIPEVKGIGSSALVSSSDEEFLTNRELLGIKWLYCGTNNIYLSIYLIVFHAFVLAGPSVRMRGDSTLFKTLSPRPDASLAKAASNYLMTRSILTKSLQINLHLMGRG